MLIIKSVKLDLALIIGVKINLTILWKDNINKLYSFKVMLVSFKIIIGRNIIWVSGIKSYIFIINVVKKAI